MYLENMFWDVFSNWRNANIKELLLLIEDYLVYNIIWQVKLNFFFAKIKILIISELWVFLVKEMYITLLINSIIVC